MNIIDIDAIRQHEPHDGVLTAATGTFTETINRQARTRTTTIVATNAQVQNNGPNDRDEYRITYKDENIINPINQVAERMRFEQNNGNNYTFVKTENI